MFKTSIKNDCGATMLAPRPPVPSDPRNTAGRHQNFRGWAHDLQMNFTATRRTLALLATASLTVSGCTTYCTGAAMQGPIFTSPAALVVGVVSKAGCAMRESGRNTAPDSSHSWPDSPESPSPEQPAPRRD